MLKNLFLCEVKLEAVGLPGAVLGLRAPGHLVVLLPRLQVGSSSRSTGAAFRWGAVTVAAELSSLGYPRSLSHVLSLCALLFVFCFLALL